MLSVVFANGTAVRLPFQPDQTVSSLTAILSAHPAAALPAPGRDRAYLAAAVSNTPATASTPNPNPPSPPHTHPNFPDNTGSSRQYSDLPPVDVATSDKSAIRVAAELEQCPPPTTSDSADPLTLVAAQPAAPAMGIAGTTSLPPRHNHTHPIAPPPPLSLTGHAFVKEPPFPPRRLCDANTLAEEGITAADAPTVYVTFVARQVLVDPTRRDFSKFPAVPRHSTPCSTLAGKYGGVARDTIVHCRNVCGRSGEVYGGESSCYSRDSSLCRAALHAGALNPGEPGYFTVRAAGFRDGFASNTRNDVTTSDYKARFGAITVLPYLPGDDEDIAPSAAA